MSFHPPEKRMYPPWNPIQTKLGMFCICLHSSWPFHMSCVSRYYSFWWFYGHWHKNIFKDYDGFQTVHRQVTSSTSCMYTHRKQEPFLFSGIFCWVKNTRYFIIHAYRRKKMYIKSMYLYALFLKKYYHSVQMPSATTTTIVITTFSSAVVV